MPIVYYFQGRRLGRCRSLRDGSLRVPYYKSSDPPLHFPSRQAFDAAVKKVYESKQPDTAGFADEEQNGQSTDTGDG
jgi:hypothetical protein